MKLIVSPSKITPITVQDKNGFPVLATIPDLHGADDEGVVYMRKILK